MQIVIFHNLKNNSYYFRKYSIYCHYEVGQTNGYGHEVILVIDLSRKEKLPWRRIIIDRLINILRSLR